MKLIEIAVAASGRLVTNATFLEIAPAGGAAAGAPASAALTPTASAPTCSRARIRRGRLMPPTSTPPGRSLPRAIRVGRSRLAAAPVAVEVPPAGAFGANDLHDISALPDERDRLVRF